MRRPLSGERLTARATSATSVALVGEVVLAVRVARGDDAHAELVEPLQRLDEDAVVQRAVHGGRDQHGGAPALEPARAPRPRPR